jgi:hypothetical protein
MIDYDEIISALESAITELQDAKEKLEESMKLIEDYEEHNFEKAKIEEIEDIIGEIENLIRELK